MRVARTHRPVAAVRYAIRWFTSGQYRDAAERQVIRAQAIASGAWSPNTRAEGMLLHQQNNLTIPAFSPLR